MFANYLIVQVFIGNLDTNVTEEELRQIFSQFGDIVYVKIPASKGCGFVQFAARYVMVSKFLFANKSFEK